MDASSTQSVIGKSPDRDSTEFMSSISHIFRFSRSGKEEVDAYRFMSNHGSAQYVLFCHDPLSHLAIDASSCMKL